MNIGIIIQARMGSTRLPGKILKQFYGNKSILEIILDNLHKVEGAKVIVATSIDRTNDSLEAFLRDKHELFYRGSENDVLNRFIEAAEFYSVDGIVRICSDNPFIDWRGVAQLVEQARISDADYIGFLINDRPSILTHFGFWGEFVRLSALKRVAKSTEIASPAHEHVTYHIYNHPDEYKCEWISGPDFLHNRDDIRLTIDTPEDLANASKVYSDLKTHDENFTLKDVINYLDAHEEIKKSMISNIIQNKK